MTEVYTDEQLAIIERAWQEKIDSIRELIDAYKADLARVERQYAERVAAEAKERNDVHTP